MKRASFIKMAGLVLMAGILVTGCGSQQAEEEVADIVPLAVTTVTAVKDHISEVVELTGTVTAQQVVNVVPKGAGRVEQVTVRVGDKVNRGDLIISLDSEDLSLQLRQSEAALAVAEANLAAMRSGARPEEIAQARNGVTQAQAAFENAGQNFARLEALHQAGAIPLQQVEAAQLQLIQAETAYKSAKEGLSLMEQGASKENLAVIEAQVRQAEAGVDMLKAQINNVLVTAPVSGVVAAVNIEIGELAGAGVPVATIMKIDEVDVEVNVSEANINQIKAGDKVEVLVSAVASEPLTGKVTIVSPAVNPQTRQYSVKISLENNEGLLKPGMFARVYLVTAKQQDAVKIPKEAVVTTNGQKYVFVVEEEIAVQKEVTLGLTNNSLVQITGGVMEAEEVVVKGQHRLTDGQPVIVENGVNQ